MDFTLSSAFNILLHLNLYVSALVNDYPTLAYFILMLIIFAETGLVVAFFLPGDSLLFATGIVFAAAGRSILPLILLLTLAAFLGDNSNYWIGRLFGRKLFVRFPKILKWEYLEATERFYVKHGKKAILMARYLPFFRTFVPFVGGLSRMFYPTYLLFSLMSAAIWVNLLLLTSYYFGNISFIARNFSLVIIIILFISAVPALYHFLKEYKSKKAKSQSAS